jgi:hypothetical protein
MQKDKNHIEIHISNALNHNEWEILRSFCEKVERLINTKLVSSGQGSINGNMKFDKEKGLSFKADIPPEEQVAEFLLAFRFFYMQKEETCFPKILSILGKHTIQPEARQALKLFRKQWKNSLFSNAAFIKLNDKQITTSLLLDLWFNAHYFHSDKNKENELKKITKLVSEDFAKYMLLDAVYESSKVVLKIYRVIKDIVKEYYKTP